MISFYDHTPENFSSILEIAKRLNLDIDKLERLAWERLAQQPFEAVFTASDSFVKVVYEAIIKELEKTHGNQVEAAYYGDDEFSSLMINGITIKNMQDFDNAVKVIKGELNKDDILDQGLTFEQFEVIFQKHHHETCLSNAPKEVLELIYESITQGGIITESDEAHIVIMLKEFVFCTPKTFADFYNINHLFDEDRHDNFNAKADLIAEWLYTGDYPYAFIGADNGYIVLCKKHCM